MGTCLYASCIAVLETVSNGLVRVDGVLAVSPVDAVCDCSASQAVPIPVSPLLSSSLLPKAPLNPLTPCGILFGYSGSIENPLSGGLENTKHGTPVLSFCQLISR